MSFVRKGFIGLTDVEEYDKGIVYRHELTHSGPKMDRWRLTEARPVGPDGVLVLVYERAR